MNKRIIQKYLTCPSCRSDHPLSTQVFAGQGDEIQHGIVTCEKCQTWYRIEDGLLEMLVPALRDQQVQSAFQERFRSQWGGLKGAEPAPKDPKEVHKIGQRDFYNTDAIQYETHMLSLSFWKAFDRTFLEGLRGYLSGKKTLLEIGGGTGRVSIPLAETFDLILSFDLSEMMVRTAIGKRDKHGRSNIHYFVADAENIPVRSNAFEAAVCSGILHHVERPDRVTSEMARVLVRGGRFAGNENNRSAFRMIFDILMKLVPLWNEKAHEDHYLISDKELDTWLKGASLSGETWMSVFLPPQALCLLPPDIAYRALVYSNRIAGRVPWIKKQGGLILFKGEKKAA